MGEYCQEEEGEWVWSSIGSLDLQHGSSTLMPWQPFPHFARQLPRRKRNRSRIWITQITFTLKLGTHGDAACHETENLSYDLFSQWLNSWLFEQTSQLIHSLLGIDSTKKLRQDQAKLSWNKARRKRSGIYSIAGAVIQSYHDYWSYPWPADFQWIR